MEPIAVISDLDYQQINHHLENQTELYIDHYCKDEYQLSEYHKGQVIGMVKIIKQLNLDVDVNHYLRQLY